MPKGSLPGTGGSGLFFTDASLFIETYCLGSFLTGVGAGEGVAGVSSGAFFLAISRRSAKASPLGGGPGGGACRDRGSWL